MIEEKKVKDQLVEEWLKEEALAHIKGWDFSHIHDRYKEEENLPWDYEAIIRTYLKDSFDILDYDTGGGEFLLTLGHPYDKTWATEGYLPNVELCKETLSPLGIHFEPCENPSKLPFPDASFDLIINRHGDYDANEIFRVLKEDGLFITQQVGGENDRDLVEMVLPGTPNPFPQQNMKEQQLNFQKAGFQLLDAQEAFCPISFYDVGAFVWFAHIIEWEFPGFSVENCLPQLMNMQKTLEESGEIKGTIHRFMLVVKK